ncbi:CD47 molecule [Rhinolophus ferrumequinum]|uniref:CD47 molecule n=1 Tax=Rhinolophus ferrumequinum TaxID=59479 RepID=A0A7J8ADA8_RHIFE|nr:CD47 molecule [Rhinolophus ferrumequinum]
MWPLVVVLLLNSAYCGSAQLILNVTKFVEYTNCNTTVLLPCIVYNIEATGLEELFVKWKFGGKYIFTYDGAKREPKPNINFSSAKIFPDDLLKGNASLEMNKEHAIPGNYTCEVTELSREGDTVVELKYRLVSWFSPNENILIVIFPMLAILLISGLGIVALAELLGLVYMKFTATNQRTIQPPRKAVEEPLNAFKESKGMMNDE